LAIQFVKNVIVICADPIAVEASNRQRSSIRKGDSICCIINYKTQVLFAPRRRFPGRCTNDDDLRRRAAQIVRANTGRATTTIMIATTAHLVGSQSARKRTANPPAVPRDYAIKSHLALPRSPRRATNPLPWQRPQQTPAPWLNQAPRQDQNFQNP
jgi:hypothetical protein